MSAEESCSVSAVAARAGLSLPAQLREAQNSITQISSDWGAVNLSQQDTSLNSLWYGETPLTFLLPGSYK